MLHKRNYSFVTSDGIKDIAQICKSYNANTLLDYGCGMTYLNVPDVNVNRYDPHFPDCNTFPTDVYDIVVCHNSLNHVDRDDLKSTMATIYNITSHALVVNIQFPGINKARTAEYEQAFKQAQFTIKDYTRTPLNAFEKLINVDITSMQPHLTIEPAVLYFLLEKGPQCSSN